MASVDSLPSALSGRVSVSAGRHVAASSTELAADLGPHLGAALASIAYFIPCCRLTAECLLHLTSSSAEAQQEAEEALPCCMAGTELWQVG